MYSGVPTRSTSFREWSGFSGFRANRAPFLRSGGCSTTATSELPFQGSPCNP